jgi:uncharacterized Zn-binding protein involved in type VI secretion
MDIIGFIRFGDKAACGGMVSEGIATHTRDGKPISFQGARMACKRGCIIAGGWAHITLENGRNACTHGHLTSGGCPLISTLNEIDGVGASNGGDVPVKFFQNASGEWVGVTAAAIAAGEVKAADDPDEYDEQARLDMATVEGMPYFIETNDGRTFSGQIGPDGLPPRIETYGPDEYRIWWGDDALVKMGEGAR